MYIYLVVAAELKLGPKRFLSALQSFDVEFQPFIKEINAKEKVIREHAVMATMQRIRGMPFLPLYFCFFLLLCRKPHTTSITAGGKLYSPNDIEQNLTQAHRNGTFPPGYYVRTRYVKRFAGPSISSYKIDSYWLCV